MVLLVNAQNQQDSSYLDKNFEFVDGVFLNFEAFKSNQPSYSWDELKSNIFTNPISATTYIKEVYSKDSLALDVKDIWGISLAGLPYVNTLKQTEAGLYIFALLKVRGSLSMFQSLEQKKVETTMHAFNPRTGIPFRTANIERIEEKVEDYILDMRSGLVLAFSKENLLTLIYEDELLLKSVSEVKDDQKDRLIKSLMIYCDRNPVKVPVYN